MGFLSNESPVFISETHEWYLDKDLTQWAHREDRNGSTLPQIFAYRTKFHQTHEQDYVLVNQAKNQVVYASKRYEDVCCHIDILKLQKQF